MIVSLRPPNLSIKTGSVFENEVLQQQNLPPYKRCTVERTVTSLELIDRLDEILV